MLTFEYYQEAECRAMRLDGIQEGMEKDIQEGMEKGIKVGIERGMRNIIF